MGATDVINAKEGDVTQKILDLTQGQGAHFVFETAGSAKTFRQTSEIARDGGTVVLIGLAQEAQIPMPWWTLW